MKLSHLLDIVKCRARFAGEEGNFPTTGKPRPLDKALQRGGKGSILPPTAGSVFGHLARWLKGGAEFSSTRAKKVKRKGRGDPRGGGVDGSLPAKV